MACTLTIFLATGTNAAAIRQFFSSLASLAVKDLGRVNKCFGMRAALNVDGDYSLDQEKAIGDLLLINGLADANSTRTQIDNECNKVNFDKSELLGASNTRAGLTIRDFQSFTGRFL